MSNVRTQDFQEFRKFGKQAGTTVCAFRLPDGLVQRLDWWASARGLSRNQAGQELLRYALAPRQGGFDPLTGEYRAQ
jgi:hypothetical protein